MRSVDTLCTDRLVAERLRASHLDELCRMHRNPQVMATLGGVRSDERTLQELRQHLDHWEQHGYGLWLFRSRADGQFVGRGGLRNVDVAGRHEVELAFALMAPFWGKGFATEMAEAIVSVAFGELGMAEVVAFTLPANQASRRVMEKVGFRFERDIVHAGLPHVLYRLRRAQRSTT
jgi:ribosomal-protein-alanine N-acetyltransferase